MSRVIVDRVFVAFPVDVPAPDPKWITVAVRGAAVRGEVRLVASDLIYWMRQGEHVVYADTILRVVDEGITWVRGWPAIDCTIVRALLATAMLAA